MGLPEIFISFQTAAVSAITRSARGVLAVAVKDATAGGATEAAYKSLAEVPEDKFSPENYRLLKLAFLAVPTKVWVLRVGEDAEKTRFHVFSVRSSSSENSRMSSTPQLRARQILSMLSKAI